MRSPQRTILRSEELKSMPEVEVEDYPWQNFSADDVAFPDNPRKTVILKDLHTEEELKLKVREPEEFKKPLKEKSQPLFPVDLTKDYIRSQEELMLKKRRKLLDEDEAVAFELANYFSSEFLETPQAASWKRRKTAEENSQESQETQAPEQDQQKDIERAHTKESEQKSTKQNVNEPKDSSASPSPSFSVQKGAHSEAAFVQKEDEAFYQNILQEKQEKAWQEGYAAGMQAGFSEGKSAGLSEGHKEGYNAGFAQGLEEGKAEGRSLGYEDGLQIGVRDGETKGFAAGMSQVQSIVEDLRRMVLGFEKIQEQVLLHGRDIFLEVAKIATESILRAQLLLSDETLQTFFMKVIAPYQEKPFVVVDAHPETLERLKKHIDSETAARLRFRENPQLFAGDLRLEDDNEVVVVDIKRSLDTLFATLSKEIFAESHENPEEFSAKGGAEHQAKGTKKGVA